MANPKKNETEVKRITEGVFRKVFYLKNLMMSIVDYTTGPMEKPDPLHSHDHEQISYIAKGQLFVVIGDNRRVLGTIFADGSRCCRILAGVFCGSCARRWAYRICHFVD